MPLIINPTNEIRHPNIVKSKAYFKDHKENIRLFMESLANIKFELGELDYSIEMQTQLSQNGFLRAQFPTYINAFPEYEKNRQLLVLLGAAQAANYRYAQPYENKDLEDILKEANEIGKEKFGRNTPVRKPTVKISGLIDTETSFTSHFENPILIKQLISIIERGRVFSCLFEEYYGMKSWCDELFPLFHEKIYSEKFEEVEKNRVDLEKAQIELKRIQKGTRGAVAQIKKSEEEIKKNETYLKVFLFEDIMRRLMFASILGNSQFDNESMKIKFKRVYDDSKLQDIYDYLDKGKREYSKIYRAKVNELSDKLANNILQTINHKTSMREVIKKATEAYIELTAMEREGLIKISGADTRTENSSLEKTIHTLEEVGRYTNMENCETFKNRFNVVSRAQEERKNRLTIVKYPEWDFTHSVYIPKHATIVELKWDEIKKGFVKFISQKNEKDEKEKVRTFYSIKKDKKQEKNFKDETELSVKQPEHPELDGKLKKTIAERFSTLRNEGEIKVYNLPKGKIDMKAYVRHRAKITAGIPVRPNFFFAKEKKERSVASIIIVDSSDSTGELLNPKYTVLDYIKQGCMYLAHGLENCNDAYAVYGATSFQDRVVSMVIGKSPTTFFYPLKKFDEKFEDLEERINYLAPIKNNRDGVIIRHATQMLYERPEKMKLLIYISDGEPQDTDSYKGDYAWADVSKALQEAESKRILPLFIRVHDTNIKNLSKHNVRFRKVKPDMSDLTRVLTESYIGLSV